MSTDEDERIRAALALGSSPDPRVVEALGHALHDAKGEVRDAAWTSLKQRVSGPALVAVLTAAAQRGSVAARRVLLQTCAADCGAVDLLLAALDDGNPQIRAGAALGLEALDDPRVLPVLVRIANTDPVAEVRAAALRSAAATRTMDEADLRRALADEDIGIAEAASRALSRRDPRIAAEIMGGVALPYLRVAAIDAVRDSDAEVLVPALIACARVYGSDVQAAAARGLARHCADEVTRVLCGLLRDTEEGVKLAALDGLTDRTEASVTTALIDLASTAAPARGGRSRLFSSSWLSSDPAQARGSARSAAIAQLASRPGDDVTAALCAIAVNDLDPSLRADAVRALGGRTGDQVDTTVRAATGDIDAGVAAAAVEVAITHRGMAASLLPVLSDEASPIAADVATLAGRAPDPAVAAALEAALPDLLRSPSSIVRGNALAATRSLFTAVRYPASGATLTDLVCDATRRDQEAEVSGDVETLETIPSAFLASASPAPGEGSADIAITRTIAERCAEPALAATLAALIENDVRITAGASGQSVTLSALGRWSASFDGSIVRAAHVERAAAAVADASVVAAITSHLRGGPHPRLQHALELAGPVAWPALRSCLQKASTPDSLLVAALRVLSKARDTAPKTIALLLDALEHRSRAVRAEAAVALRYVADHAVQQFGPALARSGESRQYLEILLSLLEGKSLPHSQALVWTLAGEAAVAEHDVATAYDSDPDGVGPRMDTHEHLMELARCTGGIAAPALVAGLAGAYWSDAVVAWIAAAFGVPAAALRGYLPPPPISTQIVGLACSVWVGMPVAVVQLWRFIIPGLYERERRLGLPLVLTLMFAVVLTPVVAALIAFVAGQLGATPPARIWMATHVSLLALATTVWAIGVRPIWRLLSAQLRVANVLTMAAGGTTRVLFSEADLLWAVVAMFVLSCAFVFLAPFYVTAGACAAGFVGCLCLSTAARVAANAGSVAGAGPYWRGFWVAFLPFGLGAAVAWPIAFAVLAFVDRAPAAICDLELAGAGAAGVAACLSGAAAARPWFLFVHASWIVFAVGPLLELPFVIRSRRGLAYFAGYLSVPVVALLPLVVMRLIAAPVHAQAAAWGWSPAAANFAVARLALVPALAYIALATARLLTNREMPDPWNVMVGIATVVMFGVLPSVVLAVPFAVTFAFLTALAVLAIVYLPRATMTMRDLVFNVRLAMDEFMRASRELGRRLSDDAEARRVWRQTQTASRT